LQGITLATASSYFSPAIDVISIGGLTHGYGVADFSLKILKGEGLATVAATESKLSAAAALGTGAAHVPHATATASASAT
jgi:hypothetical protein